MKWSGPHQHTFDKVVRSKGPRVRFGCNACPKIGPWVRYTEPNQTPTTVYADLKVAELRALAKSAGVRGFSKMPKPELIECLSAVKVE